ncbi:MAG: hypothetical protein QOG09_1252 [Solirubrobacterales bacterium]|nr:hypothetical protein [Solirubrobacterales bacterium]MDX6663150.1 hypothetical protein [Solirubrobacterales bacterium]
MIATVARLLLAGVLVFSALAKLAAPRSSQLALGTFGFATPAARWVGWSGLIAVELALAAGVVAGADIAAYAAAAFLAMLALTLVSALLRGRAGAPCGCFGARSRVSWRGVIRNLALAVGFAALPLLPEGQMTTDQWLGLGAGAALVLCAALGVAVLALAREVGMLRLQLGPQSALEIAEEGPELGGRTAAVEQFEADGEATLPLAVFVSANCHICQALEPAIASLGQHPQVALRVFEEGVDAAVWRELHVPGSPYAVAMDRDGTVLAKGTFNNMMQLESVVATAERRRGRVALEATRA